MSNAKPLDLSLPYQVADISLADFGKKEMQLSEREMPGLMELIRRYGDKKPLKGFKVMGSLHMTIQTAMLIKTLYELERIVGAQRICWRYDPVLLTRNYSIERHFETFDYLCGKLADHVDRCIFSFVEIYRKLEFNMPELIVMSIDDMDRIAAGLGRIAATHGILLQTCGTDVDWSRYGIRPSGCMTLEMLGSANGIAFKPRKHKGQRSGCHCIESRDIGAYDSCPNSCRYCYANKSPERALKNYREAHDPNSPLLLGHLRGGDIVTQGAQRPFRRA